MGTPCLPNPPHELLAALPGALLAALPPNVRGSVSIRPVGDKTWEIGHPKDARLRVVVRATPTRVDTDDVNHVWSDWLAHRLLAVIAYDFKAATIPDDVPFPESNDPWPTFEEWLRMRCAHAIKFFGEEVIWTTMADLPEDIREQRPAPLRTQEDEDASALIGEFAERTEAPPPKTTRKRR